MRHTVRAILFAGALVPLLPAGVESEAARKAAGERLLPAGVVRQYLRAREVGTDATRYLARDAHSAGDGCYAIAAHRWAVQAVRTRGAAAEVDVDVWALADYHCEGSTRHYPPYRARLTFQAVRQDGRWRLLEYHPLVCRSKALEYARRPFYLVIAGSFRSAARAERHAEWVDSVVSREFPAEVRYSNELANLEKGWHLVVPDPAGHFTLRDARKLQQEHARHGVAAYIRRVR
jgi:hypothetical protein